MQFIPTEIYIYPFMIDDDGDRINTHSSGYDEVSGNGWNVQLFGLIDGTAGCYDDQDFPDQHSACDYAYDLADLHDVRIAWTQATHWISSATQ